LGTLGLRRRLYRVDKFPAFLEKLPPEDCRDHRGRTHLASIASLSNPLLLGGLYSNLEEFWGLSSRAFRVALMQINVGGMVIPF